MVLWYPKDCCKLQQSKIFVRVILKMVEKKGILATRRTTRTIATEKDTHSTLKDINVKEWQNLNEEQH